jgi:hypothetical protein
MFRASQVASAAPKTPIDFEMKDTPVFNPE